MHSRNVTRSVKVTLLIFLVLSAIVSVKHSFFNQVKRDKKLVFEINREGKLFLDNQEGEIYRLYVIDKSTKFSSLNNRKPLVIIEGTVLRKTFVGKGMLFEFIPHSKLERIKTCWYFIASGIFSVLAGITHAFKITHLKKRCVCLYGAISL